MSTHTRFLWFLALAVLAAALLVATGLPAGAQDTPATLPSTAPATSQAATTEPTTTSVADSQPTTTTAPTATSTSAPATATATAPAPRPTITRPMATNGPIILNFKDASLRTVLEFLSEVAGLIVVEEARLDGRVTLMSRQPVTAEEATALLDTVLRQKGLAAIRMGRTLKIVTLESAKRDLVPVRAGNKPEDIQPSDRIVTQIIPIRYADAIKLKSDLASLIPSSADVASNASSNTLIVTGTEAVIRRVVEIIQAIDVHMSEVSQVKVWQLKYANATNAARLITSIFSDDQPSGGNANNPFGRGGRAFVVGLPQQPGADEKGQRPTKVLASADERTNTLVVSAAPDVLKAIESVVKELDANPAAQQAVFTYRLKNAKAKNVESVLNNIFGWSGSSSSSSANQQNSRTMNSSGTGNSAFGNRTGSSSNRGLGSGNQGQTANRGTGNTTGGGNRTGTTGGRSGTNPMGQTGSQSDLLGQVYVVADEDTNSLLVTTATANFERVKGIIQDLDRAVPQVLIKVLIAEVTHDKSLDLGVEFSGMNLRASGNGFKAGTDFAVAAQKDGFSFKLSEENVTAAIHAIAGAGKLDVLSRPYILTSDNQEASIMVGQEVPFITRSQTTDTGQTINTIEYDSVGIILDVTPHINPNGLVTLDVYPEISTQTGDSVPISDTVRSPVFARRYAQSRVAIRDGQTIVIGGLMEDRLTKSVDKVPILGDIPCLGALFSRTIETKTKTELLIFLTPHVALQPDELKEMSEDEKAGLKLVPNAVEPGTYDDHMKGMQRGASTRPACNDDAPQIQMQPTSQPDAGANNDDTKHDDQPRNNAPQNVQPQDSQPQDIEP
jgi:general secretion pathway protein D